MGLLSFFSGKKNKEEKQNDSAPERPTFDSELGRFYYVSCPDSIPPEFGYEGEIDWPGNGYEDRLGVYIDCESPDSTDAGRCYEKLVRIAQDKERTEYQAKSLVAEHFLGSKPELIKTEPGQSVTKEDLMKDMRIDFISIYRSGDIVISVDDGCWFDLCSDGVEVILKADGSSEVKYKEYD